MGFLKGLAIAVIFCVGIGAADDNGWFGMHRPDTTQSAPSTHA